MLRTFVRVLARRISKLLPLLSIIFFLSSVTLVYALDDLKLECDGTFKTEERTLPFDKGAGIHFTVHLAATSLTEFTLELSGPLLFTNSYGTGTFVDGRCSLYPGDLCISKVYVDDEAIRAERLSSVSFISEANLGGFSDWVSVYINRNSGNFSFHQKHSWREYPSEYKDEKLDAKCVVMGIKKF